MILIEGTIRVADFDRARPAMAAVVAASRAEPGCVSYAFAQDLLDPNVVHIVERWESREALTAHAASAHFQAWRAQGAELGISDRDLRLYEADGEQLV